MSATHPLYRLDSIRHSYADRLVLQIDRLEVMRGETLGIIGPSGAGKTTLLRLLQFLERPSGGTIAFEGRAIERDVPLSTRRRVTTVFQRPVVLDRSVRSNLTYGARVRGLADRRREMDGLLAALRLDHLAQKAARTLSGGEIQRMAFGRAVAFDPEVLLLDEPTANLDPRNVKLLEELIRERQARGVTIVLATHQIFQARRLAHRTAFLLDGQIVEIAATPALFDAPKDPRTRAFLTGDMVY
jgi:tungstate transport system ATP-binding protein